MAPVQPGSHEPQPARELEGDQIFDLLRSGYVFLPRLLQGRHQFEGLFPRGEIFFLSVFINLYIKGPDSNFQAVYNIIFLRSSLSLGTFLSLHFFSF